MILVIDNFDSFTYNIAQYLRELGENVKIVNNQIRLDEVHKMNPDFLLLSPGPKTPSESGNTLAIIEAFCQSLPILGVCLGHQCIAHYFGGDIVRSGQVMHGKTSLITHNNQGVFKHINSPFRAMRYHSLAINPDTLPDCLEVTAWADNPNGEARVIMGIKHKHLMLEGVQFHPESVLSECGHQLLANFLEQYRPYR